jgi:hypothetical protein
MTVAQLAEHWQLSPRTIHRMITQGLPVLQFGRALRIHPKVVVKLESHLLRRGKSQTQTDTEALQCSEPTSRPKQSRKTRD